MANEPEPNFEGHAERECGEHRTVGSHRAWCYDCHEWCYPESACKGCELPMLRAALLWVIKEAGVRVTEWDSDPYGHGWVGFFSFAGDEYGGPIYPKDEALLRLVKRMTDVDLAPK